jgi:hypothetical protein
MPTFQRNMLSPPSRAEVAREGYRGFTQDQEEKGLREGSQSEGENMEMGCELIGSLLAGYWEGAGYEVEEGKKTAHFRAHQRASCSC